MSEHIPPIPWLEGWLSHMSASGVFRRDNPYDSCTQTVSCGLWDSGWSRRHKAQTYGLDMPWDGFNLSELMP